MKVIKSIITGIILLTISVTNAQTVKHYAGIQYFGTGFYNAIRNNHKDSVYYSAPWGITIDTAGRVYISNEHNIHFINGTQDRFVAGYNLDPTEPGAADSKNGAGITARFARPGGLTVNPSTNAIIVADIDNNQIRLVEQFINNSTSQAVSTYAGVKLLNGAHLDGANASAKFYAPAGVVMAPNGDVYVADRSNHCIRKISNGNVTTIAGTAGTSGNTNGSGSIAKFNTPTNLIFENNFLYVSDYGNSAIRKIDLSNNNVTDVVTTGLYGPTDVCKVGNVFYISERLCIKKLENNVVSIYAGSSSQNGYTEGIGTNARFEDISAIEYNRRDNQIYVVDMGNNVVRVINSDNKPIANFTTNNVSPTKGQTIILRNTSANIPRNFKWTITPGNYTLQNNSKLTDSTIYVSFSQAASYTVKLWVNNVVGSDSISKSAYISVSTITDKPSVEFTASKTNPTFNEEISLIDLSANEPNSWKWRISPNTFVWTNGTDSNSRNPNVKFTNGSNYTVTLIASNGQGSNQLTKVEYIKVNTSSTFDLNSIDNVIIYPNPSQNELNVLSNSPISKIEIIDLNSKILLVEKQSTINVSNLENGIYYIRISSENTRLIKKLIINH